jgi:hypothetical protein
MAEWLVLPDGKIRRVVTVGTELRTYPTRLDRIYAPALCEVCGRTACGGGRTCGSAECVDRVWSLPRLPSPPARTPAA